MNALAHCVEAVWSPHRTPEAEAIARRRGPARSLPRCPRVVEAPGGPRGRGAPCSRAPCLAGRCLHNASMGVHHGLAQLLGGRTGLPHGLANAVLLAHCDPVQRARGARRRRPHRRRRWAIPPTRPAPSTVCGPRSACPGRLSELGVDEAELEVVARLSQGHGTIAGNPRPVGEDDALAILRAAW